MPNWLPKLAPRYLLRWALSLALLVASFWVAFRLTDWTELWATLRRADYGWLPLCIALMLLSHLLRAWRWRELLRPVTDRPPRLWHAFSALMIGYAVNMLLPRAGELVRPYVLSRRERLPMATALSSVIVERTLDSLTLLLLVGIGLPLFADVLRKTLERLQLEPAAALPLLVGLLAVLLALMSLPRWAPGLLARLGQHAPRAAERLRRLARELYAGAAPLRSPRLLWRIGVQTALLWVCYLLPLYGLFWVFRLELTLWDAALVLLVSAVAIAVAPTPSAAGIYHVAVQVVLMEAFALPAAQALGYALVAHATNTLVQLAVGALCWLWEHAVPP